MAARSVCWAGDLRDERRSLVMVPALRQRTGFFDSGRWAFGAKGGQYGMKLCVRVRVRGGDEAHTPAVASGESVPQIAAVSVEALPQQSCSSPVLLCTVGSEPMPPASIRQWHLTDKHLLALSIIACVAGSAVTILFMVAIPTMLAFKNAAESLEKLLDVTREELPGTMAAIRLSGMEISDLTVELSEFGQEITQGVRSSARAVRAAENGILRMSRLTSRGICGTSRSN